ncbi:hypothetical protein J3R82DRAFT_1643 [Butyriboletus roseoflavus]|nr:hypothetical protein J3R82DRAFT_1643 [Butyriboletus roseoflavus]
MPSYEAAQRKRVAIIGAGAAGMSAAYALSLHPDRFSVTIFEQSSSAGGMAMSSPLDKSKYGADYINDGVQGASPVFYNTYAMFDKLGFKASPVGMQVSFGRDPDADFWSNMFPSRVIDRFVHSPRSRQTNLNSFHRFRSDIRKFGRVLRVIKALEPLFAVISVEAMLKMFRFSQACPSLPYRCSLIQRTISQGLWRSRRLSSRRPLFRYRQPNPFYIQCDIRTRLHGPFYAPRESRSISSHSTFTWRWPQFEYSPESFLASIPEMRAFPRLSLLYQAWADEVQSRGNVTLLTQRQVTRVVRGDRAHTSSNVQLWSRSTGGTNEEQRVQEPLGTETCAMFDELIMTVDADSALRILGGNASWLEKKILGNVKYIWDVSVTHSDLDYMDKYYRLHYDPSLNSSRTDEDAKKAYELAQKEFAPLYFIRSYPDDKRKVEMSFNLTNYQPQVLSSITLSNLVADPNQFKGEDPRGPQTPSSTAPPPGSPPPLSSHVFQTIFLDRDGSSEKWSRGEIKPENVICEKWWKQQSHRWQHYAGTVSWMMYINGKHHTSYAGAWTILNMHEIAIVSGLAAAYRLGAGYPFNQDEDCKRLFRLYLAVSHGSRMRAEDRRGVFA